MSEWIDVPVAEVAVGDSVKIKGYGRRHDSAFTFGGHESYPVVSVAGDDVTVDWMQGIPAPERYVSIVRSSIVAARRRKPEPAPKPGDWRCVRSELPPRWFCETAMRDGKSLHKSCPYGNPHEVYRASSGWSRNTRTGQPWVMKTGDPVEILIRGEAGNLMPAFFYSAEKSVLSGPQLSGPPYEDFYKRIGLDVRPVDHRGKR